MRLDPPDRGAILERHLYRCFLCQRPATHVDGHTIEVRGAWDEAKETYRRSAERHFLPFCRRCWAIATGAARARKGQETKAFNRRQLPLRVRGSVAQFEVNATEEDGGANEG